MATPLDELERLGDLLAQPAPSKRMLIIVNPYATTVSDRLKNLVVYALRGRYQVYTGSVRLEGTAALDQLTSARADIQLTPIEEHPWCAVAGVAFLWHYVHLTLGAGYGNYFVPGIDLAVTGRTFFPDGSLALVF